MKNKHRHLTASSDWDRFIKRRANIVNLYNDSQSNNWEAPNLDRSKLTKPELLHAFWLKGVFGGVLIEQLLGQEHFALITFAAIHCEYRSLGIATNIVNEAVAQLKANNVQVIGVQLNPCDAPEFWGKFGFDELTPYQNGYALLKR